MKMLSSIAILSTLTFSNVMASNSDDGTLGMSISTTVWLPLGALSYAYAPALSVGALEASLITDILASSVLTAMDSKAKKELRLLVNNDAQDFYATGKLTAHLEKSIELLKQNDENLSDSEAVDQLIASLNE